MSLACPNRRSGRSPAIDDGVVTIEDERIVAVGRPQARAVQSATWATCSTARPVNAHTHLEFSHLDDAAGPAGNATGRMVAAGDRRARATRGEGRPIDRDWHSECILAGTSAVGDIATVDPAVYEASSQLEILSFMEAIGFSAGAADSAFAAVKNRIADMEHWQVRAGLSPHAPYTVSPELVGKLVTLAREHQMPVAMHLAECPEELELLFDGTGPLRDLLEPAWDVGRCGNRPREPPT